MPATGSTLAPGSSRPASAGSGQAEPPASSYAVLEQELTEVEAELCPEDFTDPRQRAMAANLTQRQRDQEFLEMLALTGFHGPAWDLFANELAAYGIPVLMSWTRTRKIAKLCADKHRPLRALPADWPAEERMELTTLTVAVAIKVFREKVLVPRAWDVTRGSTLKTFFMGTVILQFPNTYNGWYNRRLRDLIRPALLAEGDESALATDRPYDDPASTAINRVHLWQVLGDMPEDLRMACLLMLQGASRNDAAAAIGKTGGALGEQLRRYRNSKGGRMR